MSGHTEGCYDCGEKNVPLTNVEELGNYDMYGRKVCDSCLDGFYKQCVSCKDYALIENFVGGTCMYCIHDMKREQIKEAVTA